MMQLSSKMEAISQSHESVHQFLGNNYFNKLNSLHLCSEYMCSF